MMKAWSERYLSRTWEEKYPEQLEGRRIRSRREELAPALDRDSTRVWGEPLGRLAPRRATCRLDRDCPQIGAEGEFSQDPAWLEEALRSLMPWRKGPLSYFGTDIDAEWRSDRKWSRVESVLPPLEGKRICDVGCNNGYYMLRMLARKPELVLGVDPMVRYWFNHWLHHLYIGDPRLVFELFGAEDLDLFPRFFDVLFYMGILYHRRDPVSSLTSVASCLKPGGVLILESAGIPGEEPYCLFPESRYLKAPGYWFLPTAKALTNMLNRTGFKEIDVFHSHTLEKDEQRQTDWARFQSLEHFLDPQDETKTLEGYPAPRRIYVKAVKC